MVLLFWDNSAFGRNTHIQNHQSVITCNLKRSWNINSFMHTKFNDDHTPITIHGVHVHALWVVHCMCAPLYCNEKKSGHIMTLMFAYTGPWRLSASISSHICPTPASPLPPLDPLSFPPPLPLPSPTLLGFLSCSTSTWVW